MYEDVCLERKRSTDSEHDWEEEVLVRGVGFRWKPTRSLASQDLLKEELLVRVLPFDAAFAKFYSDVMPARIRSC